MNVLAIALLLSCLPTALIDFALPKWKADKNVRIDDAYKWTFQATRGGEHAVPDTESARKWLDNEWNSMTLVTKETAVWESLCPGGEIGRLNLRPFKNKGGEPDDLLDAFLASSREYRSDGAKFIAAWNELGKRLKEKSYGTLNHKDWSKLDAEMKAKNYPAVHHSETYNKAELPAYRILTATEYKKLLVTLK